MRLRTRRATRTPSGWSDDRRIAERIAERIGEVSGVRSGDGSQACTATGAKVAEVAAFTPSGS